MGVSSRVRATWTAEALARLDEARDRTLIEQQEAGHSDALTAYLDAMSRFHDYSFGKILEIGRQRAADDTTQLRWSPCL
jgi:hypothetical protein